MDERTRQIALGALRMLVPLLEQFAVDELRRFLDGRADNMAKNDRDNGWSAENIGDPRNDYVGDVLSKRADNMLFVLAAQLPGRLSDGFRDGLSPVVTPLVRESIDATSTPEEIASLVVERVCEIAEAALDAVTP